MQFMSSTSVNCIEEIQLLMPILLPPLLLLLLLLAKKFLAISNSNVEKRAVVAGRVDGENTLLDSLANCVPRPPDGPQLHGGKCSKGNIGRGRQARMHWKWWPQPQACQDAGHGTLLGWHSRHCILFSAHANAQKYAAGWQSMKRERGRKGGKGNCNDADNDLKFIKNSKICVAKNMQYARQVDGKVREGSKASASPKNECVTTEISFATVIFVALVLLCSTKNAI